MAVSSSLTIQTKGELSKSFKLYLAVLFMPFIMITSICAYAETSTYIIDFGGHYIDDDGTANIVTTEDIGKNIVLRDTLQTDNGIRLELNGFTGINAAGSRSDINRLFSGNIMGDSFFGHDEDKKLFGQLGKASQITIEGLIPEQSYNLDISASRLYADDNRQTEYKIIAAQTQSLLLNTHNNISEWVTLNNISPDSQGKISIEVKKGPDNNNNYGFYYIGGLIITTQVDINDTQAPTINLVGDSVITISLGDDYVELGATAFDHTDGDITSAIAIEHDIDTLSEGIYTVSYSVTDAAGNSITVERQVRVVSATLTLEQHIIDFSGVYTSDDPAINVIDINSIGTAIELVNIHQVNQGISVLAEGFTNQNSAGHANDLNNVFVGSLLHDSFFGHDEDKDFVGRLGQPSLIKLQNLNPNKRYNIDITASRLFAGDNRQTEYEVLGAAAEIVYLNVHNNQTEFVSINNTQPSITGEIIINIRKGPNNNNNYGFYYIGGLSLIENSALSSNEPPQLDTINNQTLTAGHTLNLPINFSDIDGSIDSIDINGADFIQITAITTDSALLTAMTTEEHVGQYNIAVAITDDQGATTTQTFQLSIHSAINQAPVLASISDTSLFAGQNSNITLSYSDSDGTIDNIDITGIDFYTLNNVTNTSATLRLSPSAAHIGQHQVTIVVSDNAGGTASQNFLLTVNKNNNNDISNLALSATRYAYNEGHDSTTLARVNDGNIDNTNVYDISYTRNGYIELHLDTLAEIHEIHVEHGSYGRFGITNANVQAHNGACFNNVPGGTIQREDDSTLSDSFSFSPGTVVTDKVRLVCHDYPVCRLREIKILGKPFIGTRPDNRQCGPEGESQAIRLAGYDYALYLPPGYTDDDTTTYPLIMSLHGRGGHTLTEDHNTVLRNPEGFIKQMNKPDMVDNFPAIVIAPNYAVAGSSQSGWLNPDIIHSMVLTSMREYKIDPNRIIPTGLSAGGAAVIGLIESYGETVYAGFVPIAYSAPNTEESYCHYARPPIWFFGGTADNHNPYGWLVLKSTFLPTVCSTNGDNITVTAYPDQGHNAGIWDQAWSTPELHEFFLNTRRSDWINN